MAYLVQSPARDAVRAMRGLPRARGLSDLSSPDPRAECKPLTVEEWRRALRRMCPETFTDTEEDKG